MSILIDGSSDYVDIDYSAKWILNPASDEISISYWAKVSAYPSSPDTYQLYFQINEAGAYKITLMSYYHTDYHLIYGIFIRDSDWVPVGYLTWMNDVTPFPTANTWNHVVVNTTVVGANSRLYFNKVSYGVAPIIVWSSVGAIDPHEIFISDGAGLSGTFNIAHFAVVKDMLTVPEIDQHYKDPYSCLTNPDIIGYFPMLESLGVMRDKAPGPTNGTLSGATWDVGDDPLLGWANKEINDIDIVYPDKISGFRTGQIRKVSGV